MRSKHSSMSKSKENFLGFFFVLFFYLETKPYFCIINQSTDTMTKIKEEYVLIAKGGYLKEPIVEHIEIPEEEYFGEFEDEFDSFEEYKEYVLEEAAAEFEQRLAKVVIMTKQEYESLK
jgi:hypothetical protein